MALVTIFSRFALVCQGHWKWNGQRAQTLEQTNKQTILNSHTNPFDISSESSMLQIEIEFTPVKIDNSKTNI